MIKNVARFGKNLFFHDTLSNLELEGEQQNRKIRSKATTFYPLCNKRYPIPSNRKSKLFVIFLKKGREEKRRRERKKKFEEQKAEERETRLVPRPRLREL